MAIQVTWFGHAGFQLDYDGITVLVDPFLTGNPLATVSPDTIPADYILVTHGHGDHLGDTIAIARRTGALVVTNNEIHHWLEKKGVQNTHGQATGGGYQHPFGHVKLVKAEHGSSLPDGSYGGQANGIVLTADDKRLYFAGDTALFSDMRLIGDMGIDIAFLPIGDNYTMGPEESLRAIEWIRPQAVFPIHYNTFELIYQDVASWAQRVHNETSARPIVVDPGSHFTI